MGHGVTMARGDHQMRIRISADLLARIEAAAASTRRSLNAEISARLEDSFVAEARDAAFDDRLGIIEAFIAEIQSGKKPPVPDLWKKPKGEREK